MENHYIESPENLQLKLQNALIRQKADVTKLKAELDDMEERAGYYENLYNRAKRDLYELELKYHALYSQKTDIIPKCSRLTNFFGLSLRNIKKKADGYESN